MCGSADHPQVALSVDGAPTRSDEEHARTEYENAEFDQQTRREVVATLRQNLAVADHASGGQSVAGLRDELAALRERRAASAAAASERDRLATSVADLEAELADAIARLQQLAADEARLRAERDHAQAVVESVSAELSALFAEDEVAGSVSRLIEARTAAGTAFGMAREALAARDRATTQAQEAGQRAQECALEHGFADTATATRAVLAAADHARLEQLLRERDALRAQSRATLADAEVTAAVAADTPDLAALAEAAQAAEAALTDVAAVPGRRRSAPNGWSRWSGSWPVSSRPGRRPVPPTPSPPACRRSPRARAATTPCRCGCRRTCSPRACSRSSRRPTSGCTA